MPSAGFPLLSIKKLTRSLQTYGLLSVTHHCRNFDTPLPQTMDYAYTCPHFAFATLEITTMTKRNISHSAWALMKLTDNWWILWMEQLIDL